MKNKKWLMILSFLLSFLLFSCGSNSTTTTTTGGFAETSIDPYDIFTSKAPIETITYQSGYTLNVGDSFNPFNPIYITNEVTFFESSNPNVLSVDSKGNVEALDQGDATITVYKKNAYWHSVQFHVNHKKELIFNETDDLLVELVDKMNSYTSNYITIETYDTNLEASINYKMSKSPFYYEKSGEGSNFDDHTVIEEHNNKYFILKINDKSKSIERKGLSKEEIEEYKFDSSIQTIGIDFSSLGNRYELTKEDNVYVLRMYLSDVLSVFKLNIQATQLPGNAIFEYRFNFSEYRIETDYTIDIHYIMNNRVYDESRSSYLNIDFRKFRIFDDSNYRYGPAKTMKDIYDETDLSVLHYTYIGSGANNYYGYLEKGYYAIENPSDMYHINSLGFIICDDNLNKLENEIPLKDKEKFCNIFSIEEDGYYYIGLGYNIMESVDFRLTKIEWDDTPIPLQSYSGLINGRYDFKEFTYHSEDENEVIKITNNKDYPLYIYSDFKSAFDNMNGDLKNYFTVEGNQSLYINPKDGDSSIYVISSLQTTHDLDANYSYEYDFTFESIHNDNGLDMDNLDLVTEEYGKEYIIGYSYEPRKVKLIAEKTGYYAFDNCFQILFNDKSINRETFGYYLEAGEYILTLWTNSHFYASPIKYTYYDTNDFDLDVTIPISGDPNFTMLRQKKKAANQVVKYYFTLETNTILYIDIANIQIFDENDAKVSFKTKGLNGFEAILQELKPGRYYFRCDSQSYDSPMYIYIYTSQTEEYLSVDLTNELELGYTYKADKNANRYEGYYRVFESDHDIDLTKSTGYVYVVDSQMNLIELTWENGDAFYHLEANQKYYVIICKNDYKDIVITEKK